MVCPPDASVMSELEMLSLCHPFSLTMRPMWPHNANSASLPVINPAASFEPPQKHCKHVEYSVGNLVSPRAEEIKVCIGELRVHSLQS